jgi:hypothetical protein
MGKTQPYFTWKGKDSTPPTNAEMAASSFVLAEEAARLEQQARLDFQASAPGSVECNKAAYDMARYISDQRHWRDYARYYRHEVALELDQARARDVKRAAEAARMAAQEILEWPRVSDAEPPEPGSD